MHINISV